MNENFLNDLREKISNLEEGMGVEKTIAAASKILGNPLFLFDICYNLITYSLEFPTDDWVVNELVTLGRFSHETVDFFNKENFITTYSESDIVSYLQSDKLKYRRMNGKLFGNDTVQIGDLNVTECYRPFVENEDTVFEILCEKISIELQASTIHNSLPCVFRESALSDILEGSQPVSQEFASSLSNDVLKNMKKNIFVSAIDISQYDGTVTHIAYFRQKLEELCPEFKFFVGIQSIIAFFSSDDTRIDTEQSFETLNSFFCKNRIFAGVSKSIEDIFHLNNYFRQAIRALNNGLQKKKKDTNIFQA